MNSIEKELMRLNFLRYSYHFPGRNGLSVSVDNHNIITRIEYGSIEPIHGVIVVGEREDTPYFRGLKENRGKVFDLHCSAYAGMLLNDNGIEFFQYLMVIEQWGVCQDIKYFDSSDFLNFNRQYSDMFYAGSRRFTGMPDSWYTVYSKTIGRMGNELEFKQEVSDEEWKINVDECSFKEEGFCWTVRRINEVGT